MIVASCILTVELEAGTIVKRSRTFIAMGIDVWRRTPLVNGLATWLVLGLVSAFMFFLRYPYAYTNPNFYAEDGKVFAAAILNEGPLMALGHLFNGYLIVGQYLIADFGFLINALVGHGFVTLPKAFAVASYLALGFACALPWLLLRRRLGMIWTLVTIVVLTFVPLGGIDFTTIGTIGNLKFLFVYIAFIFIIYRNIIAEEKSSYKLVLVDLILFFCVLTNITVVALLPLALYPYWKDLLRMWRKKNLRKYLSAGLVGLSVLAIASLIYIVVVYKLGIPKTPGYLDEPLSFVGLMNTVYRSSWYGLLFPIQSGINHVFVALVLAGTLGIFYFKKHRFLAFATLYAVLVSALGFALNRTGITQYFEGYAADGGPGQFFYGGTMVFVFGVAYICAGWFNSLKRQQKGIFFGVLVLCLVFALPLTGGRQRSFESYSYRPAIAPAAADACSKPGDTVRVAIYPTPDWYMDVRRKDACSD